MNILTCREFLWRVSRRRMRRVFAKRMNSWVTCRPTTSQGSLLWRLQRGTFLPTWLGDGAFRVWNLSSFWRVATVRCVDSWADPRTNRRERVWSRDFCATEHHVSAPLCSRIWRGRLHWSRLGRGSCKRSCSSKPFYLSISANSFFYHFFSFHLYLILKIYIWL